jgi:hypothetical protein
MLAILRRLKLPIRWPGIFQGVRSAIETRERQGTILIRGLQVLVQQLSLCLVDAVARVELLACVRGQRY